MNRHLVHLSLFDGISAGQLAMNRAMRRKIRKYTYYSSEVDPNAIMITNHNYPNTNQLGDVRFLHKKMFKHAIGLLTAGSPCQDFSLAGKRKGMTTTEDIDVTSLEQYLKLKEEEEFEFEGESYLFWEFVRLVKELKPKYFLLENVTKLGKWKDVISEALGVEPIRINSSLMTAQNRDRYYWTNIPNVDVPEDKEKYLSDMIPGARGCGTRNGLNKETGKWTVPNFTIRKDGKANCLTCGNTGTQRYILPNGEIYDMSPEEWETLQTFPEGYTNVNDLAKTHRYKAIGNSWTVDVIEHIFKHIPELM